MKSARHGVTLIELIVVLAFFSLGFVVGHFVANDTRSIVFGILSGFLVAWFTALSIRAIAAKIWPDKPEKKDIGAEQHARQVSSEAAPSASPDEPSA